MQLSPIPPQRNYSPVVIPEDVPVYLLESDYFSPDDEHLKEGTLITLEDAPNQQMKPMNALARERMEQYLTKLDAFALKKSDKDGSPFHSALEEYKNRNIVRHDGRRVGVLGEKKMVPMMGEKKRGRPRVNKIQVESTPAMGAIHAVGVSEVNSSMDKGL